MLLDILIYIILGIMMMSYDDSYDESKGEYWSLDSMTTFDKTVYFSLMFWNIINIIIGLFIVYKFSKQIRKKYFI